MVRRVVPRPIKKSDDYPYEGRREESNLPSSLESACSSRFAVVVGVVVLVLLLATPFLWQHHGPEHLADKLVEGKLTTEDVESHRLVQHLPLQPAAQQAAERAFWLPIDQLVATHTDGAINARQCENVINWAAAQVDASDRRDSIDGKLAAEVDVPIEQLVEILGSREDMDRLVKPAKVLLGDDPEGDRGCDDDFDVVFTAFARKYVAHSERRELPFHVDNCDVSISVNLSDDRDYDGGDLMLLFQRHLESAPKHRGTATTHDARVAHAVRRIEEGERWALVLFGHCSAQKIMDRGVVVK